MALVSIFVALIVAVPHLMRAEVPETGTNADWAESMLTMLSRFCDMDTLKCGSVPNTVSEVCVQSVVKDNARKFARAFNGDDTSTDPSLLSPSIPSDWKEYLSQLRFDAASASAGLSLDPTLRAQNLTDYCEGDLINVSCDEKSLADQEEVNGNVRWSRATVPFIIDEKITDEFLRDVILEAMIMISNSTCINFVQSNEVTHMDHIIFLRSHQYASTVGRGFGQIVRVADLPVVSTTRGEILHLLMHVLGFGHEHNRPDRNEHLWINHANVVPEDAKDLGSETSGRYAFVDAPYDYESITHYGNHIFAKSGAFPTLLPKAKGALIGQREKLSDGDVRKINKLYNCNKREAGGTFTAVTSPASTPRSFDEKDPVIEDTRSRTGRDSSLENNITRLSRRTLEPPLRTEVCPACVCNCPKCSNLDDTTKTLKSFATYDKNASGPVLKPGYIVGPGYGANVPSTGGSPAAAFDPVAWQRAKGQSPMDSYVKEIMKDAFQNSGLGYLFNRERPPTVGNETNSNRRPPTQPDELVSPAQRSTFPTYNDMLYGQYRR